MVIKAMNDNTKTCNRCKGTIVTTESELVCSRCGIVVIENIVDVSRDYENQDGSGGRVGPPTNVMFKETKSSVMGSTGRDASGRRITGANKSMINRISVWDKRGRSNGLRTRNWANKEITRVSEILSIPEQVKQRGAEIFRTCEERKMLRGRTTTVFSAACLYAACRENGLSKTLTDFTEICFTRRSDLSAYYRMIIQVLDIKPKIMSPVSYLSRIASNAVPPLSVSIQKDAIKLLENYKDQAGKDPVGLAAAALYHCAQRKNLEHTQRVLSMAAGITEVTIRNRINDMKETLYPKEKTSYE
jgi:transcription initiation factor TFIIB